MRNVLVSGFGIAGATLASCLARYGFTPTLIERAPAPRRGGYMIDFWGAGYEVAERMGMVTPLRQLAYQVDEVRLVDAAGRRVGGFGGGTLRAALGQRYFSIPRGDLASVLYTDVIARTHCLFGNSIVRIEQHPDSVRVEFEHGPPRTFDIVVGADGLHSTVRSLMFSPEQQFESYLGYGVAAFDVNGYRPRDPGVYVSHTVPGRQLARYALREGRTAFFFVFEAPQRSQTDLHDTAAQKAVLRERYGGDGWESAAILAAMEECDELYFDAVSQIRMTAWSRGRVALVGDACFAPPLLAGEGAGMAMAGAYVLASELRRAGGDHRAAFARYDAALRPFVERKQRSAVRFGAWFAPRTRLGLALRDRVSRLCDVPIVGPWILRRAVADELRLADY